MSHEEPSVIEIAARIAERVAPVLWRSGIAIEAMAEQCVKLAVELKSATRFIVQAGPHDTTVIGSGEIRADGTFSAWLLSSGEDTNGHYTLVACAEELRAMDRKRRAKSKS